MTTRPHIVSVAGTRPEMIKMAPLVRALADEPALDSTLLVTGQHREMLDAALADLELTPDIDLDLMTPGQTASGLVARVVDTVAAQLRELRPDMVVVHGDTGTCAGAGLAAFLERIPVGHVEAGLRSGDLARPFPEEGNRRVVDTLAQVLWAPTEGAASCLAREGLQDRRIRVTGNTVIDSLHWARERTAGLEVPGLADLPSDARVVLVTAHRRESFGEPFRALCRGLARIAEAHSDVHVVYPVHLNPKVREPVEAILGGVERVHRIEPLAYLPFVALMDRCQLVLTDSGGIQEEAPALGKPVLVMRETTERPEAVEAGTVRLVGTEEDRIFDEAARLLTDPEAYEAMARAVNPYGDGRAAHRIVEDIKDYFGLPASLSSFGG